MKISCLLLAAGQSSRMGGVNKLMLKIGNDSLVRKTFAEIKKISLNQIIIVTGHEHEKLDQELSSSGATMVFNKHFKTGMHSSIREGVKALEPCDAFFICLADQPRFDHEVLIKMSEACLPQHSAPLVYPTHHGKRGQPVLISSHYIPEILREPDGDYGCSYLLKRYPDSCLKVPVETSGILEDIDSPEDYERVTSSLVNAVDPVQEIYSLAVRLREDKKPFIMATVIEVLGSASARTGSKAIFDQEGRNLLGWVGGGCAERFISEQSLEALREKKTRIVLADLDDEIFGLGVACGGKMRVFLEPVTPLEIINFPVTPLFQTELRILSGFYGWTLKEDPALTPPETIEELLLQLTQSVAKLRGTSASSLRLVKNVPATFRDLSGENLSRQVTIVGRTRITEALARHFTLLGYVVRAIGPSLNSEDYPSSVSCSCLEDSYSNVDFSRNEVVIVAGHTSQDPQVVENALKQGSSHVAMVGSTKRSLKVLTHLKLTGQEVTLPLYVPAGLDIDARNPEEIALSIVAEVILRSKGAL